MKKADKKPNYKRKTLILVRHGQYHPKSDKTLEKLTTLGRKQAKMAGKRLKENKKIDRIVHSTMPRAVETATIIKKTLGYRRKMESCDQLRECVPSFPVKLRKKHKFTAAQIKKDKIQAERAFKKYFTLPKKDSLEVLVCHGNIIRYLVAKVMETDEMAWRRMDIQQCAICVIEIRSKGDRKRFVMSHNDTGHIPKHQRTFL